MSSSSSSVSSSPAPVGPPLSSSTSSSSHSNQKKRDEAVFIVTRLIEIAELKDSKVGHMEVVQQIYRDWVAAHGSDMTETSIKLFCSNLGDRVKSILKKKTENDEINHRYVVDYTHWENLRSEARGIAARKKYEEAHPEPQKGRLHPISDWDLQRVRAWEYWVEMRNYSKLREEEKRADKAREVEAKRQQKKGVVRRGVSSHRGGEDQENQDPNVAPVSETKARKRSIYESSKAIQERYKGMEEERQLRMKASMKLMEYLDWLMKRKDLSMDEKEEIADNIRRDASPEY